MHSGTSWTTPGWWVLQYDPVRYNSIAVRSGLRNAVCIGSFASPASKPKRLAQKSATASSPTSPTSSSRQNSANHRRTHSAVPMGPSA